MHLLSLSETKECLLKKEFSCVELVTHYINRIEKFRHLNAYITVCHDTAIKNAKESDKRILANSARYLEGIPLAIKDLFATQGVKTTAGSRMLENFIPTYESTVSARLLNEGAVFLGKTNMDEFAMGSANLTSYYGKVINPWGSESGKHLVPGGSSGGSASAVAAHLCVAATGSDTGGSIRQPAAFSGIVGLKPTYGRCSRYGMVAFASSLDQAGPLVKTVRDAAIFLNVIAGYDDKDSTSSRESVPDFEQFVSKGINGLKVGVPKEYRIEGMSDDIINAWNRGVEILKCAGADVVEVSLPYSKYALPAYYIIAPAEASSNLSRYDGIRFGHRTSEPVTSLLDLYENSRAEGFGEEVKRRILIGTYVLSAGYYDAYYTKALKVQKLIRQDFYNTFDTVDFLLTPTTPSSAFAFGEEPKDPVTMYLNDVFTVTANIAGLPGLSVPIGFDSLGKPLGLQLIAPPFKESVLLAAGQVIEDAVQFPFWKEGESK